MPVALDDPRWSDLRTAYNQTCKELISWLSIAYEENLTDELLGDIINEVQHQGDTSTAMYAVAPHLLELSKCYPAEISFELVIHAGMMYAAASDLNAIKCPSAIWDEFHQSSKYGMELSSKLLTRELDTDWFKYLLAAISGFAGQGRIGRFLLGIEFADDGIHSPFLSEPMQDI